jgi:hypothetical protein
MPAAQWVAGREAIALGNGTAVARWTAQCHRSVRQSNFFVLQTCVFFFTKVSLYQPIPGFCAPFASSELSNFGAFYLTILPG